MRITTGGSRNSKLVRKSNSKKAKLSLGLLPVCGRLRSRSGDQEPHRPQSQTADRRESCTWEWGYVALVEQKSPPAEIGKVKRALLLPPDARAVLVDSGLSLRVIVTGTPVGERLLEFNFIEEASFDYLDSRRMDT